ncbi:MAG: InlB B-repeat-containing protein, partial [Clostridia bacterium]|nr:InlB B-repeat-containing protein [Clostridia bacterium]
KLLYSRLGGAVQGKTHYRNGYSFGGWYTSPTGGKQVISSEGELVADWTESFITGASTSVDLYARWIAHNYTVHLEPGKGTLSGASSPVYIDYDGTKFYQNLNNDNLSDEVTPVANRNGYNFEGWSTVDPDDESYTIDDLITYNSGALKNGWEITEPNTEDSGIVLYAVWSARSYTITASTVENGGFISETENWKLSSDNTTATTSVQYDAPLAVLPEAKLDGYKFLGWFTQVGGGKMIEAEKTIFSANGEDSFYTQIIYARWEAIEYKISYKVFENQTFVGFNGLTLDGKNYVDSDNNIVFEYDAEKSKTDSENTDENYSIYNYVFDITKDITFATSARTGYLFNGWAVETFAGNWQKVDSEEKAVLYMASLNAGMWGDVTLVADFTPITYHVMLDSTTGWFEDTDDVEITDDLTGSAIKFTAARNQNQQIVAVLFQATYDVTYTITNLKLNQIGHDFNGWSGSTGVSYDGSVTTIKNLTSASNNTVTLSAVWLIRDFHLTVVFESLNTNNGQTTDLTVSGCGDTKTLVIDDEDNAQAVFEHAYTTDAQSIVITRANANYSYFIGWDDGTTVSDFTTVSSPADSATYSWTPTTDVTIKLYIYQRFEISYSVDVNVSGELPATQYHIYNGSTIIEDNALTRTGYLSHGWVDVVGNVYADGAEFSTNADLALTANWTAIKYEIVISPEYEDREELSVYAEYDSSNLFILSGEQYSDATATLTPTRNGYTLVGWYTSKNTNEGIMLIDGQGKLLADRQISTGGDTKVFTTSDGKWCYIGTDTKLYAVWDLNTYTITYDENGGTFVEEVSHTQEYNIRDGVKVYDQTQVSNSAYELSWKVVSCEVGSSWENYTETNLLAGSILTGNYFGDVTLRAVWTPVKYNITFNLAEDEELKMPAGLSADASGNLVDSENNIVYQFSNGNYIREFTVETNTGMLSAQKDGYTFNGWTVKNDTTLNGNWQLGEVYNSINKKYGSIELVADWIAKNYTLNIKVGKGVATVNVAVTTAGTTNTSNFTSDDSLTFAYDSAVTITATAKAGYSMASFTSGKIETTLSNVTTSGVGTSVASYNFTFNKDVIDIDTNPSYYVASVATAQKVDYVVNYYQQTASSYRFAESATVSAETDSEVDLANLLKTYPGFDYASATYYNDTENTVNIVRDEDGTFTTKVVVAGDESLVISIYYDFITYTITYDVNEGKITSTTHKVGEYSYNDTFRLATIEREGYTFAGFDVEAIGGQAGNWGTFISAETAGLPFSEMFGSVKLTAKWTTNSYNVIYNANDSNYVGTATKAMANKSVEFNEATELDACGFERDGYTFAGWSTKATESDAKTVSSKADITEKGIYLIDGKYYAYMLATSGDVNVYARWKTISYTITYALSAGETLSQTTQTYTIEDSTDLSVPTKTGYTFTGWNVTGKDGNWQTEQLYKNISEMWGNVTLSANWEANNYTITFARNGGTGTVANVVATYDTPTKMTISGGFTRTGYTLLGWSTDRNTVVANTVVTSEELESLTNAGIYFNSDDNEYYAFNIAPSGDIIVYAIWSANFIRVTLDVNDEVGTTSATVTNSNITDNTIYIRYNATAYNTETRSQFVYNSNNASRQQVLPIASRDGYDFNGWYSGTTKVFNEYGQLQIEWATLNGSHLNGIELTASWTEKTYTVIYKDDISGTTYQDTALVQPRFDNAYTLLAKPSTFSRNGYEFAGWTLNGTDYEVGDTYTMSDTYASTVTFIARWTPKDYVITFEFTGEETFASVVIPEGYTRIAGNNIIKDDTSAVVYEYFDNGTTKGYKYTYNIQQQIKVLQITKKGFEFAGWTVSASETEGNWVANKNYLADTTGLYGNVTLVSSWENLAYTVSANANGGVMTAGNGWTLNSDNSIATKKIKYDNKFDTLPTPTKTGYTFLGWFDDADFTVEVDADTVLNSDNVTIDDENLTKTIYAKWEAIKYTITYNANGGTFDEDFETETNGTYVFEYTIEDSVSILSAGLFGNDVTRAGYNFVHWSVTVNTTTGNWSKATLTSGEKLSAGMFGNTTLTAMWSDYEIDYTVYVHLMDTDGNYSDGEGLVLTQTGTAYTGSTVTINSSFYTRLGFVYDSVKSETDAKTITAKFDESGNVVGTTEFNIYFTREQHTVTLNANGGTFTEVDGWTYNADKTTATITTYYQKVVTLPDATLEGYVSTGWTLSEDGVVDENGYSEENDTYTVGATDDVLTVIWTKDSFILTLTGDAGIETITASSTTGLGLQSAETSEGGIFTAVYKVEYNVAITLTYTLKKGYQFDGYTTVSGGVTVSAGAFTMPANHVSIELDTTTIDYTITYQVVDGETFAGSKTVTYTVEDEIVLGTITKDGYKFAGWTVTSADSNWDKKISASTEKLSGLWGNVTLSANWTANIVEVILKFNHNSNYTTPTFGGEEKTQMSVFIRYDESLIYLDKAGLQMVEPVPVLNGYTFLGWIANVGGTGVEIIDKDGVLAGKWTTDLIAGADADGIELFSKWSKTNFEITYVTNGGTLDSDTAQTYTIDDTFALKTVTKTGYTFTGWKVSATNGTISQNWGSEVSGDANITGGHFGNVTLTANWTANKYTIKYNKNDTTDEPATGEMTNQTGVVYDVATLLKANSFVRSTYNFGYWVLMNEGEEVEIIEIEDIGSYETLTEYLVAENAGKGIYLYDNAYYAFKLATGESGDLTANVYAFWISRWTTFNVEFYEENLDTTTDKYTKITSETTRGLIDDAINTEMLTELIEKHLRTGFAYEKFETENPTILADDKSVVKVYYSRESFKLKFELNQGVESIEATGNEDYISFDNNVYTIRYGAEVTLSYTLKAGYLFKSWDAPEIVTITSNKFDMVGQDVTLAVLTDKDSVNFDIVYNIENVTGTGYTVYTQGNGLSSGTWLTDEEIDNLNSVKTIIDGVETSGLLTIEGFTYATFDSAICSGLGNTKINVYYTRNSMTLTVNFTEGVESASVEAEVTEGESTYTVNETITTSGQKVLIKYGVVYTVSYALVDEDETDGSGYEFVKWTVGGKDDANTTITLTAGAENVAVQAVAKAREFTVTFFENHADPSVNTSYTEQTKTQKATYNNKNFALSENEFTRSGYNFEGWALTRGGEVEYTDNQNFTYLYKKDLDLYAVWSTIKYTIAYNANGATGTMTSQTGVEYGSDVILKVNTFTYQGFTFAGWYYYDEQDRQVFIKDGKWYYVDADESEVEVDTLTDFEVVEGIPTGKATVRNLASVKDAVVTMYALWDENSYTLVYDSNYSSVYSGATDETSAEETYKFTQEVTAKTASELNFELTGYTFKYWAYKDDSGKTLINEITAGSKWSGLSDERDGTVKLYAVWQANSYSITFNKNNEDSTSGGSMNPINNAVYNTVVEFADNMFTRVGYEFAGWSTTNDRTGLFTEITDEQMAGYSDVKEYLLAQVSFENHMSGIYKYNNKYYGLNLATGVTGNTTAPVYAVWDKAIYTITYRVYNNETLDLDETFTAVEGTEEYNVYTKQYDIETDLTLAGMTKTGYTFLGWTVTKVAGSANNWATVVNKNGTVKDPTNASENAIYVGSGNYGNIILTARWQINTYDVVITYSYADDFKADEIVRNSVTYNEYYYFATSSVVGYTASSNAVSGIIGAEDVEVEVVYTPNTVKVTLDLNDVSPSVDPTFNANKRTSVDVYITYNSRNIYLARTGSQYPYSVSDADLVVPIASMTGYDFDGWFAGDVEIISNAGVLKADWTTTLLANADKDGITLTAHWTAKEIDFVIEHRYENLNDKNFTTDSTLTETISGHFADEQISLTWITLQNKSGFKYSRADLPRINPNGGTVAVVYYERDYFELTLTANTGIDEITVAKVGADTFNFVKKIDNSRYSVRFETNIRYTIRINDEGYGFTSFVVGGNNVSVSSGEDGKSYTYDMTMPANSVVATATATPKPYTIIFNGREGSYNSSNTYTQTKYNGNNILYKSSIVLDSNKFVNSGYEFAGWTTESEGTKLGDVVYKDGDSFVLNEYSETVELYAVWAPELYDLTISGDNGVDLSKVFVEVNNVITGTSNIVSYTGVMSVYFGSEVKVYYEYQENTAINGGYKFKSFSGNTEIETLNPYCMFTFDKITGVNINITTTPRDDANLMIVYRFEDITASGTYLESMDIEEIHNVGTIGTSITEDYIRSLKLIEKTFVGFTFSNISSNTINVEWGGSKTDGEDTYVTIVYVRYHRLHYSVEIDLGSTSDEVIADSGIEVDLIPNIANTVSNTGTDYRVNYGAGYQLSFAIKSGYKRTNWNITATSAEGSDKDAVLNGAKLNEGVDGLYYNGTKIISYQKVELFGVTTYTFANMCAYDLRFSIEVEPETYTITYNYSSANDAKNYKEQVKFNSNYSIYYIENEKLNWTYDGYDFAGWSDKSGSTVYYEAYDFKNGDDSYGDISCGKYKNVGNLDLYAIWVPGQSKYTIKYYFEGVDGTYGTGDDGYTYILTGLTGTTDTNVTYRLIESFSESEFERLKLTDASGETQTQDVTNGFVFYNYTTYQVLTGKVKGDDTLVLKVYYRRSYVDVQIEFGDGINLSASTVTAEQGNIASGNSFNADRTIWSGSVKFGSILKVSASVRDGYENLQVVVDGTEQADNLVEINSTSKM